MLSNVCFPASLAWQSRALLCMEVSVSSAVSYAVVAHTLACSNT